MGGGTGDVFMAGADRECGVSGTSAACSAPPVIEASDFQLGEHAGAAPGPAPLWVFQAQGGSATGILMASSGSRTRARCCRRGVRLSALAAPVALFGLIPCCHMLGGRSPRTGAGKPPPVMMDPWATGAWRCSAPPTLVPPLSNRCTEGCSVVTAAGPALPLSNLCIGCCSLLVAAAAAAAGATNRLNSRISASMTARSRCPNSPSNSRAHSSCLCTSFLLKRSCSSRTVCRMSSSSCR
mmetsp:Transcript_32443/g.81969  ORF Transcript_32443/g.81969 Transcript_32443/m.81969 type:complete len:239 (-) Transcript_32443:9-725(-)